MTEDKNIYQYKSDNSHLDYTNESQTLYIQYNDQSEYRNRLDSSLKDLIKNTCHTLFEGCQKGTELDFLLRKAFPEKLPLNCYVTNLSFMNKKGTPVKIVSIRPEKVGVYLTERLPEELTIRFKGHISRGVFVIDEFSLTPESNDKRDMEIAAKIEPIYSDIPTGWKTTFLSDLIDQSVSLTEYTEERLEEWEEYLNWKRELAGRQIEGCKYFKVSVDNETGNLLFWLVAETKESFTKFKKFLRRDSIQAFSNQYSTNQWHFDVNIDKNTSKQKNTPLGRFIKIHEQYLLNEELAKITNKRNEENVQDGYSEGNADVEGESTANSLREVAPISTPLEKLFRSDAEMVYELKEHFENPFIVVVSFEVPSKYEEEFQENTYTVEEKSRYIEEIVLDEYEKEGFLALSAVGTFVLNKRLSYAIEQLKRDESFSPNLALWLFDVTKARRSSKLEEITEWFSEAIKNNTDQRIAVQKMLSAQDLCLIQGPPGTGKTTVIAEAIYQFAIRGQSVLLASQSNDAVDNALERLANSPVIRAIRLGQKSKKKKQKNADMLNKFAEETAIEYFYKSISNTVQSQWIKKWEDLQLAINNCSKDLRDVELINQQREDLRTKIIDKHTELNAKKENEKELQQQLVLLQERYDQKIKQQKQVEAFIDCLKNRRDERYALTPLQIRKVLKTLQAPLKELTDHGLRLSLINWDAEVDAEILNAGLRHIITSFWRALELKDKLLNDNSSVSSNNEVVLLQEQQKEILEQLSDSSSNDELKGLELLRKLRQVKQKITDLTKKADIFVLSPLEKGLFRDDVLMRLSINGQLQKEQVKAYLFSKEDAFNTFLIQLEEAVPDALQSEKVSVPDLVGITNLIESTQLEASRLSLRIDELKSVFAAKTKELETLFTNYEVDNKDISNLLQAISNKQSSAKKELESDKSTKDMWESMLREFSSRLDSVEDLEFENEYYLDTYIGSCNVVGISCTDNMRNLVDKGFNEFDVVIIDEVSKATPPELLIPLMKARKAILVGDHRQLPPLFDEHERSYKEMIESVEDDEEVDAEVKDLLTKDNFARFKNMVTASLFKEYFERADVSIKHSLFTQYRMHRDIMNVINRFYENKLTAGFSLEQEVHKKAHNITIKSIDNTSFISPDKHAYWIDSSTLPNGKPFYESRPIGSTSTENILECYIIVEMLKKLNEECLKQGFNKANPKEVGVISFYQLQVNRLKRMIIKMKRQGELEALSVDINTVDRFQGKEKAIIFTSLVRNNRNKYKSESSHIAAFERINVAFSRAQEMLIIVGAKDMYQDQPVTLPKMDSVGEITTHVYRNIITELNRQASFYDTSKIITSEVSEKVLDELQDTKERRGK